MKNKSYPSGFTFVEVILVVVVLSIVLVVSVPNLSKSYTALKLQTTVNDIAYLMRYAQSRSIMNQEHIVFFFGKSYKKYRLLKQKTEGEFFDADTSEIQYERIAGRWGKFWRIPQEMSVESSKQTILFSPDGKMEGVRINICNNKECMSVSTQEQRGRVKVFSQKI